MAELTPQALDDQLHRVADQMGRKFGDRTASGEVESAVYEEAARFNGAHVKQYIRFLSNMRCRSDFGTASPGSWAPPDEIIWPGEGLGRRPLRTHRRRAAAPR